MKKLVAVVMLCLASCAHVPVKALVQCAEGAALDPKVLTALLDENWPNLVDALVADGGQDVICAVHAIAQTTPAPENVTAVANAQSYIQFHNIQVAPK